MFFLSQSKKEIAEIIRGRTQGPDMLNEELKEYERLVSSLQNSLSLYVHKEGPYPDDPETDKRVIDYHKLLNWSMMDWRLTDDILSEGDWFCVIVARGGFIIFDDLEQRVEDFMISYFKPRTQLRSHEHKSIFDEYTDSELEAKLAEFEDQEVNLILIDDVVGDGEEIAMTLDSVIETAEDMNVRIKKTIIMALLTRMQNFGQIPVYGTLIDYPGAIYVDWGNDFPDRLDYYDFSFEKEYIDDL